MVIYMVGDVDGSGSMLTVCFEVRLYIVVYLGVSIDTYRREYTKRG